MDPLALGLAIALGITLIWAIVNQVRVSQITIPAPAVPAVPNVLTRFFQSLGQFLQTWVGLTPYMFFLAGPIIDAINSKFMYSKASLVGIITVIIISLFGSDTFARKAGDIIGFIPRIYTPFTGQAPAGASWWNQISWAGVLSWLVITAAVFIPMMVGKLSGWAWGSSIAIAGVFILTMLAGNGLLGDTVPFNGNPFPATATSAGITNNNLCVTPGLEILQTRFAPAGIILTTSILSAHMFEGIDTKNNSAAIVAASTTAIAFCIEFATMISKGCLNDYKYGAVSPFISLGIGYAAGAIAYYTMKQVGQESFTSSSSDGGVFHPPPSAPAKTSQSKSDTKIVVGPPADTSEPVDDQDAFVCEAYKDGELITSTIVD